MYSKEKIIFKKNSIVLEYYNPNIQEYTREEIKIGEAEDFYSLFDFDVEFASDLTVEDFLKNIRPYSKVLEKYLIPFIGIFDLDQFFNLLDISTTVDLDNFNSKISHVEMYWNCEIWEDFDLNPENSEFVLWGSYHGVSIDENINYNFGLTPLNNWKHYRFILNPKMDCYKNNTKDFTKELMFSSNTKWTLNDIIKNFFYELTFYGSISDMDKIKSEIDEKMNSIKLASNTLLLNNDFKKIEIERLQKELENAIIEEEYEIANKLKNKIQDLKNKLKN